MNNSIKRALLVSVFILAAPSLLSAKQKIVVRVDGLSCAFCAYGLEKKLGELEEVEKVQINLKNGTAVLTVKDDKTITDEQLKKIVSDAGFTLSSVKREPPAEQPKKGETKMEVINLNVIGMRCSGCVYNIETVLKEVPGVHSVEVSLENSRATVEVEEGSVKAAKLIEAIEKSGRFKVSDEK